MEITLFVWVAFYIVAGSMVGSAILALSGSWIDWLIDWLIEMEPLGVCVAVLLWPLLAGYVLVMSIIHLAQKWLRPSMK